MQRIVLCDVGIDVLRMDEAVGQLLHWVDEPLRRCRLVVTPNVDHTVMLRDHQGLRTAYDNADMILADGVPLVLASRLLGKPLPERVPGSELVPALFAATRHDWPLRAYLLGAGPGVAERAAHQIERRWPGVWVVGTYSPPFGFEHDMAENQSILRRIADVQPDVLVVGLGAPKQEMWVHQHRDQIKAKVALCVGATIDFLAGEKRRAPVWMQKSGLEWFHRMMSEPKRLAARYARGAWVFPQLVWQQWWSGA